MGFFDKLRDFVGIGRQLTTAEIMTLVAPAADYYYRELAFWSSVRLLGNAMSQTHFRTLQKGKEFKGEDYYRLNVRPNRNQNSSRFYQELIGKLCVNNDVLIIQDPIHRELLIADSFDLTEKGVSDWIFENVTVNDFTFKKRFRMSEVIFLRLNNENINTILKGVYKSHAEMIAAAQRNYKHSRGNRLVLNISQLRGGTDEERAAELRLLGDRFKSMFEAENGIAITEKGQDWKELAARNTESSREVREMADDIFEFTARAFGISPALLRGNAAELDGAIDFTLMFGVNPIVDLYVTEANSQLYTQDEFLAGTRIVGDTSTVKPLGLKTLGSHIDKLISNGLYSVNELRQKLNEPSLDEDWADKHWITKNYGQADSEDVDGSTDDEDEDERKQNDET